MAQQKKETYRNVGFSIRGNDQVVGLLSSTSCSPRTWSKICVRMLSNSLYFLVKVHYILHSHLQSALEAWQTFKLGFCVGIGSRNRRALLKLLVAPRTLEIFVSISDMLYCLIFSLTRWFCLCGRFLALWIFELGNGRRLVVCLIGLLHLFCCRSRKYATQSCFKSRRFVESSGLVRAW
jgi:hypothetical protein